MALRLIAPPGVSDSKNFRAREAYDKAIEDLFKLVGSVTVDLGSIAAGATGTTTIPVIGARKDRGMTVQMGLPSTIDTGLIIWGNVTADDVVTVYFYNRTGLAIDLGSLLYSCRVMP